MADYTNHKNMRIASGKTMLINKTSTFLFT